MYDQQHPQLHGDIDDDRGQTRQARERDLGNVDKRQGGEPQQRNVILSTTTSTQDSGLLEVLIPLFEKQSGYMIKTVSVGTGQALALAAKGDARPRPGGPG